MQEPRHQFREELRELERQVLGGLDLVIGQLDRALESVSYQDVELASMVVADDDRIDGRYLEVHQGILSLLARQSPVATDLRIVAALLHCIRCIERMGDQCVNIAKLVPLSGHDAPKDKDTLDAIERMGQLARSEVSQAKDALSTRNVELAQDIVRQDAEINGLNRHIFRRAVEIGDDLELREWGMFMILVARCLERVGDNAVEIAEQVVFVVTGLFKEMADIGASSAEARSSSLAAARVDGPRGQVFVHAASDGEGARRHPCAHERKATPDRRLRRRRVLDGVGQSAARRPRPVADRGRMSAGVLPAHRQRGRRPLRGALLPRVPILAVSAVAHLAVSPRDRRGRPAMPTSRPRTSSTWAGAASSR